MIGITAASGDAMMDIVIFAEELSFEQRMGYDIRVPLDTTNSVGENSCPGETYPGAPSCVFRGKTVPEIFTYSPGGSITCTSSKLPLKDLIKSKYTIKHPP